MATESPDSWEEFAAENANAGDCETTGRLVSAVKKKDVLLVRKALSSGAKPDELASRWSDQTAPRGLQLAAANGSADIVELLLRKGADLSRAVGQGYTALDYAVFGRHYETVAILTKHGADAEKMNCEGISPMSRATQREDMKMLSILKSNNR